MSGMYVLAFDDMVASFLNLISMVLSLLSLPQVASGFLLRVWPAHYKAVSALSFTKCGTYLVTGGRDGLLHLWDAIR